MSTGTTPSAGPSTAPASPDIVFDDVKNQTTRELQKLKDALKVNDADPNHSAEWEKIKKEFEAKKDTITKISAAELAELKREIEDPNNILAGNLNVVDGSLIYNADIADETPTTPEKVPETPTPEETIDLVEQMGQGPLQQVPESYQKEVKNHIVNNGGFAGIVMKGLSNWVVEIIKGIRGFFATFGMEDEGEKKDALAQINGFEDAEEERRVTASVKMLKSSPVTKGPPLSDLLRISHISNEELTKILKDNPGLDFSSTKNIEAAFTGKYKHSGDREPMKRYERIFINLTDIHNNLDPSEPYNAVNKFKEILAGSQNAELDIRIPATVPSDSVEGTTGTPTETETTSPTSPEAQRVLLTQAKDLDTALSKAKAMPERTDEEKNKKQEAVKNAEEALKKFQEERKNSIVNIYTDTQKKIQDTQTTIATLESRRSPDESEKKQLEEEKKELGRLQKIEGQIKTQVDTVMTQNNDVWEIKPGISAEKITATEIAISAIESNTATIETQELTEEEKKQKEAEKTRKIQEITEAKTKLKDNNQVIDQKTTARDASIEKYKLDIQESIDGAKKILEKYQNDTEITSSEAYKKLSENIKFAEAKRELIKAALASIGTENLNWNNDAYKTTESGYDFDSALTLIGTDVDTDDTDDDDDGWVEIEDGKIQFDVNWGVNDIDLKCDQKIIDALKGNNQSGIWIARNIIIENKDIIKNRSIPE